MTTYEHHQVLNEALENEAGILLAFVAVVESVGHHLRAATANSGMDPVLHGIIAREVANLDSARAKVVEALATLPDGALLGDPMRTLPDPNQFGLDLVPLAANVPTGKTPDTSSTVPGEESNSTADNPNSTGDSPDEEKAKTAGKKSRKSGPRTGR